MPPPTFASKPRRSRRLRTLIVLAVVIAVGAGALILFRQELPGPPPLPKSEVDGFLAAWEHGDAQTMADRLDAEAPGLESTASSLLRAAPGSHARYTRTSLVRSPNHSETAIAKYHARVDVAGFGRFEWNGTFTLTRQGSDEKVWLIKWKPGILYPGLKAGQHLSFGSKWPTRASILAADGSMLAGSQAIVTIGLEPDRVTKSLPKIKQLMRTLVGTDAKTIDDALHGPGVQPNYFVPIATVPDDDRYNTELRPQLAPVDGVFFQHSLGVLTASEVLGPQLVGEVGEITAERLKELGAPYRAGNQVGLGGVQEAYEHRLAGRPSGSVVVESKKNEIVRVVKRFPGRPARPVVLTIDPGTQHAAESALAGVDQPAALVAVDTTTGRIRAVVSKPDTGFQRALDGAYPPGSTFKIITAAALLANGSSGSTPAPCPPTLTVDGRPFRNFEGEASGSLDLAEAFKISCNNAFIGLGDELPDGALERAAAQFGFNAKWSLPVPSAAGSFPKPRDRAELAASAIGQGRVLASPAQMASVAAAVASGQWRAPSLTTEPAVEPPVAPALGADVVGTLRGFMASVVQPGGTAAGAGLPAGTAGKTGTAEFGTAAPPETHAWFIGYQGSVAFAVVVEGGGVGGRVAAPLAAKFLAALASG